MNIIVVRADGSFYTRPDTTLKRVPVDFYLPDDIGTAAIYRCSYVTITRAAKAIPERFATRCYSEVGGGVLIYGDDKVSLLDYSSYFFQDVRPASEYGEEWNRKACEALARISRYVLLRCADIVAFEEPAPQVFGRGGEFVLDHPVADQTSFRIY